MRYTFINENTNEKFETNDCFEMFGFEMNHNCHNNNVIRVIVTEKYIITTYKSGYTLFIKK